MKVFLCNLGIPAIVHLPLFEILYNHAFLGESIEGIAIIAISKPPSTYAFESMDISILF